MLGSGKVDCFGPSFNIIANVLPKFDRRAREQDTAHPAEARLDVRIGEARVDLAVELKVNYHCIGLVALC